MDRPGIPGEPEATSNMFAFFLSDLRDPAFRDIAQEHARSGIEGFKNLLDQAVEQGELAESYVDTQQLAETIYSLTIGTLMRWSIFGEGSYRTLIRGELDVLLRPFRRGPRKALGAPREASSDRPGPSLIAATAPAGV
jgi:hypothetical protein